MNEKIIAREVAPGAVDFRSYFDGDVLSSACGENCAVYIPPISRHHVGFNADEYETIQEKAERLLYEYFDGGYAMCEIVEDFMSAEKAERMKTPENIKALEAWAKKAEDTLLDADRMAEYLTITTGEPWTARRFTGYCQGDYCQVVYCTAHHSEDGINEVGNFWLGCGTEFIIDDCGGYYVLDTIRWDEGEPLRALLAEYAGCKPEELEVYLYDGEHTVTDYKIMGV